MQGSIVCDMIEKMKEGRPGGEDVCGLIAIPEPCNSKAFGNLLKP